MCGPWDGGATPAAAIQKGLFGICRLPSRWGMVATCPIGQRSEMASGLIVEADPVERTPTAPRTPPAGGPSVPEPTVGELAEPRRAER